MNRRKLIEELFGFLISSKGLWVCLDLEEITTLEGVRTKTSPKMMQTPLQAKPLSPPFILNPHHPLPQHKVLPVRTIQTQISQNLFDLHPLHFSFSLSSSFLPTFHPHFPSSPSLFDRFAVLYFIITHFHNEMTPLSSFSTQLKG